MTNIPPIPLPPGIRSSYVDCTSTCGLKFHYLESGHTPNDPSLARRKPLLLFLHGYPEIAYSWRKILPTFSTNYHAVALDQRGYGRTEGWDDRPYDQVDLNTYQVTQLVADIVCFVNAIGHKEVKCLVGHDFGSFAAGSTALARPDFIKSVVLMSHPFKGAPSVPFNVADPTLKERAEQDTQNETARRKFDPKALAELAKLDEPRKHYAHYNSTPEAAADWYCGGDVEKVKSFLRGYMHLKSRDWKGNDPHTLKAWNAEELAKLPHYYVMKAALSMPETVTEDVMGEDCNPTKTWLPDEELDVYVREFLTTGFQGGLNWYRSSTHPTLNRAMNMFAWRRLECPALLLNGDKDWGKFQRPGEMEDFDKKYVDLRGVKDVKAGHWPQQEDPEGVIREINAFLETLQ